jgi:hypothetical protein
MSEVIPFKNAKPLPEIKVWVCLCGCCTFEMLSDSTARCAMCAGVIAGEEGGWHAPDVDTVWDGDAPVRDVYGNGCEDFARRLVVRYAEDPDACAVLVFSHDGAIKTWCAVETPEQLEWFYRKLDEVRALVGKKFSGGGQDE